MAFLARDGAMTRAQSAARLERELASQAEHGLQYWRVVTRAGGVFLGCCGLKHVLHGWFGSALGWGSLPGYLDGTTSPMPSWICAATAGASR